MTYSETLAYLFTQLPMYQREGKAAYKADLSNTQRICDILDHPELQFKSVHIGGTNGKGSTSNYVASILQEAGLKVGLYTSPHLVDFRERIRINGQMIPEEEVVSFVAKYNTIFAEIKPSFFEWTVGLAFSYFAAQKVDIVVIEVGLGGRLDSTNVITPLVSAITNIGMDHMQFLGDNLESIAKEKAGIIKPGVPVVIGEYQEEIASLFEQVAKEKDAPLIFADQASPVFDFSDEINYQQKNIQTASQIAVTLRGQGYEISGGIIQKGINNMFQNMHLRGRWEVLQTKPKVIADTAHNQEGLTYTMEQLLKESFNDLRIVFGMVNDKNPEKVLAVLPNNATYYLCAPQIARAMPIEIIAEEFKKSGKKIKIFSSVLEAKTTAISDSQEDDMVYIGGSTFVVAESL